MEGISNTSVYIREEAEYQCKPDALDDILNSTKKMNKYSTFRARKANFSYAIEQISIAAPIKIVTSQRRNLTKFRIAEKNVDLSSWDLKMSIKRTPKWQLMSTIRVAFDDKIISEQ